jgi:predicted unusual protein kinase regulating ubiquinone biosynthesis (AarF/ABC1/UbiB family)
VNSTRDPPAAAPERARKRGLVRELGRLGLTTARATRGFMPLLRLLAAEDNIDRAQLSAAIDRAFEGLYQHSLVDQTEALTRVLRQRRLIPNEQSTEEMLRFVVNQVVARSPAAPPEALVQEFWSFFNELFASPELKGLGELTLDMARTVLRAYEPLLVEVLNLLKAGRRFNQWQRSELGRRAAVLRHDAAIVRRQLRALRYIRPFFEADPRDYQAQARIVAQMVREFGPFFVKLAQVAAANSGFLPEEIARELAVFQEDVAPMSAEEVTAAFLECCGKTPDKLYLGFEADKPLKSGSIGSIYLAKKPFWENGREVLVPVIVKVGRHNIDREFAVGKLVLGLAIMSSQYWAPHSRLTPFLRAMQEQVDEFIAGFVEELDFEAEARNQLRFYRRSQLTRHWRVPQLYGSSRRILEMEYLGDAASLTRRLERLPLGERRRLQAHVAEQLLYAVLYHAFVFHELHGDLHPGNLMIDREGALYLIDWGNVIELRGKWRPVWDYLAGVVLADSALLADALIHISTQPEENAARREEIKAALDETLRKKQVTRLTATGFMNELRSGGLESLHRRGQAVLHLLSNTQHAGVVLKRDYLHLSRALMAVAGSFGSLYQGEPRRALLRDLFAVALRLPVSFTREVLRREFTTLRGRRTRPADEVPWTPPSLSAVVGAPRAASALSGH